MTSASDGIYDSGKGRRWHAFPFEFGCSGPLTVRYERILLGLSRPLRILYASDLHLGHWWTGAIPQQLLHAARQTEPDVILLGGDLVDRRTAVLQLQASIRALTVVGPVYAIPGNHDRRVGIPRIRTAALAAGGHWLPDRPAQCGLWIDAEIDPNPGRHPRLLCAHYPHAFPAAVKAGYRLVLAGHLHGGQCVLAVHRSRLYPAVWFNRWHGLRFTQHSATLLVSRGAADSFPFRFNCPREVILCTIS